MAEEVKILSVETMNEYSNIIADYIDASILNIENKLVPKRLSLETADTSTKEYRKDGRLYVDQNNASKQITLQEIKDLNTKITTVNSLSEVNFNKIDSDDYILEKQGD